MGKKYKNVSELCTAYNISEATLKNNCQKDANIAMDDIVLKMLNKRPYQYVVYGKGFPTIKSITVAYSINYNQFIYRMRQKERQSSLEEIIEELQNQ